MFARQVNIFYKMPKSDAFFFQNKMMHGQVQIRCHDTKITKKSHLCTMFGP